MLDTCRRMSSIEVVRLAARGPGRPSTSHRIFGFRVARARFFLVLSARHPADSFIRAPLIELGISNVGNRSKEMRGSDGTATITPSIFPRAVYVRKVMERMSSFYYKRNRVEPVNEIRTARRSVLARLTLERTMGHGESQIGYLANYIIM
jgi:hypothetical protein